MSYAEMIGYVPEEHRQTMVRPFDGFKYDVRDDGLVGIHNWYETVGSLAVPDPEYGDMAEPYAALFAAVAEVGKLSVRSQSIWIHLVRGPSVCITGAMTWHQDNWSDSYRRLITSDISGTLYDGADGSVHETPDFGILKVDNQSTHCPQIGFGTDVRTRLQIEVF